MFKALIIVHLMIREGQEDAALIYLSDNPKKIAPTNFSEGEIHGESAHCITLTNSLRSAITGTQHPAIFRLSNHTREGIRSDKKRLCSKRTGALEATER